MTEICYKCKKRPSLPSGLCRSCYLLVDTLTKNKAIGLQSQFQRRFSYIYWLSGKTGWNM